MSFTGYCQNLSNYNIQKSHEKNLPAGMRMAYESSIFLLITVLIFKEGDFCPTSVLIRSF